MVTRLMTARVMTELLIRPMFFSRHCNFIMLRPEDLDLLGVVEDKASGDDVDGQGQEVVNWLDKLEIEEGDGHNEDK